MIANAACVFDGDLFPTVIFLSSVRKRTDTTLRISIFLPMTINLVWMALLTALAVAAGAKLWLLATTILYG